MGAAPASEPRQQEWPETRATLDRATLSTRAQWLWTLLGFALLGGFLALVVEDFPLRSLIAAY